MKLKIKYLKGKLIYLRALEKKRYKYKLLIMD